ncbi:SUKH-4 family immunity protein [Paenibacillus thiaminolyticus]|uniref:SUKH-4 family immunity protein n=1 Tax=Paenibacillus thiaminolyticus TaxID=49283 RepID=UPI0035A62196
MITPREFLDNWNKDVYGLVEFNDDMINSYNLSKETKDFLIIAGLPESASPYLSFDSFNKGGGVRLIDKYDVDKNLSNYIYVGFTATSDPVCIVEGEDTIVYLDYENNFEEVFINSTVSQFAESLLAYVDFIKKIKAINGRKAFLERNAPKDILHWIAGRLVDIDSQSLEEGNFWTQELELFLKD